MPRVNLPQLSGKVFLSAAGKLFALAIVFGLIYAQSPLYTSNQNQYFLHGLAKAGFGYLERDWLANTLDPTPVFSLLVMWTYRVFNTGILFFGYYALLLAAYLFSLVGISRCLFDLRGGQKTLIYLTLLLVIHSAALRFTLSRTLGEEWTYLLEGGVAGQRVLGEVFQPSTFGIFLVVSIYLFLKNHRILALLAAAIAASVHPTYLLSAGLLVLAYLVLVYREERSLVKALAVGLIAFVLVLPILVYVYTSFDSSGVEVASSAQRILVRYRIPHHAQVAEWLNTTTFLQVAIILAGIWLVRHTKMLPIMSIPLLLGVFLTILQVITQNNALALLFPWRISVILVPLATSILLAYCVSCITEKYRSTWEKYQKLSLVLGLAVCAALMAAGTIRFQLELRYQALADERGLFSYINHTKTPSDVYLVPTKMQEFRLATGAPIFVDFKAIPYQDKEVLEWSRRMQLVTRFYNEEKAACGLLAKFHQKEGVTQVVMETDGKELNCIYLKEIFQDDNYRVFEFTK